MSLLPGLAELNFTPEDADIMMFMLKMDADGDGMVSLDEMKKTDFTRAKEYIENLKSQSAKRRNVTSEAVWVWHDEDELLKFEENGYFEAYHER